MRTKAELKHELEELRQAVKARTERRMPQTVVECYCRGELGETRLPGIYHTYPDGAKGTILVYEGDEPPDSLLKQFRRDDGGMPIVLCLHDVEFTEVP